MTSHIYKYKRLYGEQNASPKCLIIFFSWIDQHENESSNNLSQKQQTRRVCKSHFYYVFTRKGISFFLNNNAYLSPFYFTRSQSEFRSKCMFTISQWCSSFNVSLTGIIHVGYFRTVTRMGGSTGVWRCAKVIFEVNVHISLRKK